MKDAFQLRQSACHHKAFFVIYLDDVVQNFQVHGGGEEILTDAFDDVGTRFGDFSGFEKVVVERSVGIDAYDLYAWTFFLSGICRRR